MEIDNTRKNPQNDFACAFKKLTPKEYENAFNKII